jgi:thiol-disulfide isomerase/thioredoxin
MKPFRRPATPLWAVGCLCVVVGCSSLTGGKRGDPATERVHALLLNGGGEPRTNYRSHLHHVRTLTALLRENGVPAGRITVFSSDGEDPAADLATRERKEDERLWLLPRGLVVNFFRPPIVYTSSALDGFVLRAARKDALRAWFAREGAALRTGDTLLLYVTDHGERNEDDPSNNTITLWDEKLSVSELRELLALLNPGVRVVMLMSQCFSGAFAHAAIPPGKDASPPGNVCGYFSVTAQRPAYGCYPENLGKDGIGHSHEFFEALVPLGRFSEAQRRVLVTDDTPDVPHTTTDFWLEQRLRAAASAEGRDFTSLVDGLLDQAWQDRGAWEPEIRLLDRIGHTFGSFSPRSLAELGQHAETLPEFSSRLATYADRWEDALEALKIETLQRFLDAHPDWRERLDLKKFNQEDEPVRKALTEQLLSEVTSFVESDAQRVSRLRLLQQKADEAFEASYRAEVRLGVILRMRTILTSIAGRVYVQSRATFEEQQAFERLQACQDVALTQRPRVSSAAALEPPPPFPPLAEERRLVEAVMPAWMGIHYQPIADSQRRRWSTEAGAVAVTTVYPDSPANAAGLRVGDIILGPPDQAFREPHQVREWTMRSEIGRPEPLAILREGSEMQITLRPGPFPLKLPELPGPPPVGSKAPPLKIEAFRGGPKLVSTRPRLLFFWATWCLICHSSLPEVLAFAEARNVRVVAITDEDPEIVERFLGEFHEPFPEIVATDPFRITFQSYGVSGTPTFVLLDGDGLVRHYQSGYHPLAGLQIDGWKWTRERRVGTGAAEG